MKLSAIIITKNEEANLERCLRSISWVDEIVVVDSCSTDGTVDIARQFGARLFSREWEGFGPAKQYALEQASGDWILSIDADEEVSFALKNEIQRLLDGEPPCAGYAFPRKTQFLDRWILHSGWYPDYVPRLFRRPSGKFNDALIHEGIVISGKTGRLNNALLHYSYPTLDVYIRKLDHYSALGAEKLFNEGKRYPDYYLVLKPMASFIGKLLFQQGWRDGWEGFLIAYLSATGTLLKYAKLRSLHRTQSKKQTVR